MIIGIVGPEGAKFTPETKKKAISRIYDILTWEGITGLCSGGCHRGGIDIWAEELAERLSIPTYIYKPKHLRWADGYMPRNIKIADRSAEVHCITLRRFPEKYHQHARFEDFCYHCKSDDHIVSGGCWTMQYAAKELGKPIKLHVIE